MPLVRMTKDILDRGLSRTCVFGPPNSGKTHAAVWTSVKPAVLISVPGEHGYGTIPADVPGLIPLVWGNDAAGPQSSESIKTEVEREVKRVIAGQYDKEFGRVRTLVIDGYHKMYSVYLNIATGGAYNQGEDFEAQRYARAHRMSDAFLDLCLGSPIEYVIFTTWNALEADKPGQKQGPMHQWPDLPGRAAKDMVGKFTVVCYSMAAPGSNGQIQRAWGLKPNAEVWGNSVKLDARLMAKLPATCPQDFKKLYEILGHAAAEVKGEDSPAVA